jgi:hypothetical protein
MLITQYVLNKSFRRKTVFVTVRPQVASSLVPGSI